MIDFKNKDELTTNVVILGSLAVFFLAGGSMVLLPKPAGPNPKAQRVAVNRIRAITSSMKKQIDSERKDLSAKTWEGTPEQVGPVVLKQVNSYLESRHLKLVGFHAEKAMEMPNITLIPFVMSVDGAFTNVMAFMKSIEKPETKLVVNLFQVSNSNQSDDKVTASIGLTAYQLPQIKVDTSVTSTDSTDKNSMSSPSSKKTSPATPSTPAKADKSKKGVKPNA
jgi:hypothetical protein